MTEMTPFQALETAVEAAGSQAALADQLGVSQTAVWKWLQSSKRLPAEHVLKVADLYDLSPSVLRPDLYPHDLGQRFYGVDRRAHRQMAS